MEQRDTRTAGGREGGVDDPPRPDADADADAESGSGPASAPGSGAGSASASASGTPSVSAGAGPRTAAGREPGREPEPAPASEAVDPKPKPVVKPLVSDLPEWPRRSGDGAAAGTRPEVAFGPPGRPTAARTTPGAPPRPGAVAPPPAAPGTATPPAEAPASGAAARSTGSSGLTGTAESGEGEVIGPEGTRGLPVPPSPEERQAPLKLLAELTNTPPPPPTLMRAIARRFKIWTPLVVLLAIVFVVVQALRPLPAPALTLTAAPTYTFSGAPLPQSLPWPAEGQSVAEVEGLGSLGVHGAQTPVPIASVTKVMTAYVVLRDHPLSGKDNGPVITVDPQAAAESASTDESTAHVKAGQKFTERQMLQLLLIPSGNNIARLLARWDAGTQEAFVAKMRQAATGLGMTHTTYTGASGFEETTVSTAVDQLKLAREVMKNDVFRSVVAMPNIAIPGVGKIYNNNQDLVHFGVVGIKTGSSTPAGGALMWAARRTVDGRQQLILGVVLQQRGGRSTPYDMLAVALASSQKLIDAIQGGLTSAPIVKKGQVVGYVDDGLGGQTAVVAAKDLTAIGWPGMKTGITLTASTAGIPHSAAAGTRVGTLSFGTGTAKTSVPVQLQTALDKPSFGKKLTRIT